MTPYEFDKLLKQAEYRTRRLRVIGRENSIKYKVDTKNKKIWLTEIEPDNSGLVDIPDFVTDLHDKFKIIGLNKKYQILQIKVGKNLEQISGLLKDYCGGAVVISGGQEKLIDLQRVANNSKLELIEFNFNPEVKPITMKQAFMQSRIHEIRFQSIEFQRLQSVEGWMHQIKLYNDLDLQKIKAEKLDNITEAFRESSIRNIIMPSRLGKNIKMEKCFYKSNVQEVKFIDNKETTVENIRQAFKQCTALQLVDFGQLDLQTVQQIDNLFDSCENLTKIKGNINLESAESANEAFKNCRCFTEIDFRKVNLKHIKSMDGMFENCVSLTNIHLGEIENEIEQSSRTFRNCESLHCLKAEYYVKVNKVEYMFSDTDNMKEIDTRNWFTQGSNIESMQGFIYKSKCQKFSTDFEISIGHRLIVNNCIQNCDNLTEINFFGRVILESAPPIKSEQYEKIQINKQFIKDNPSLKEINFFGGLYIKQKKVRFQLIQNCNNLRIIRSQNRLDINYLISNIISLEQKVKNIYSYSENGLFVYEIVI